MTTTVSPDKTATLLSSNTLHVTDVFKVDSMHVSIFPSSAESGAAVFTVQGDSALLNLADVIAVRDWLNTLIEQGS